MSPEVSGAGSTSITSHCRCFDYGVHQFPDSVIMASILSVFPWYTSSSLRVPTISIAFSHLKL